MSHLVLASRFRLSWYSVLFVVRHGIAIDQFRYGPGAGIWESTRPVWPAAVHLEGGARKLWNEFPGRRCLLILHDGEVAFERYAEGASATDQIELDSIGKTISALLIGVLVTQGRAELDKPLAEYNVTATADWGNYWPQVTARHLLTHTSGLGKEPPGTFFQYNSGEHIQHLSLLIEKVTSPPLGHWSSPVEWAEDSFSKPLGLEGLFQHDDLDGQISIGGGQMLSCREVAKVGQLILNAGWWPIYTPRAWPISWVLGRESTSFFPLIREDYLRQMFQPSFPTVVSTYGFLTWLNRNPQPGDSDCCMCTCGVCLDIGPPPILGPNVREVAWIASGFLTKYMIVLPQRHAMIISLGFDLVGSSACSAAMSWAALTYDDAFGSLLHYRILNASLPPPDTTSTSTTSTTSTGTLLSAFTTSTTSARSLTHPSTTGTLAAMIWSTAAIGSLALDGMSATTSSTATTSFNPFDHMHQYGGNGQWRTKGNRNQSRDDNIYHGGSCTCNCPIDEDFGRCFDLPHELVVNGWGEGQRVCEHFFSRNHWKMVKFQHKFNDSGGSCPDVGLVQACQTNAWLLGGGTRNICGGSFWLDTYGLNCSPLAECDVQSSAGINRPTEQMATCTCQVTTWECEYDREACDATDPYYPRASPGLVKELLKGHLDLTHHSWNRRLALSLVLCGALAVVVALFSRASLCCSSLKLHLGLAQTAEYQAPLLNSRG